LGALEALLEVPADYDGRQAAVLCHPHPLFGGTLHNKVVHMAARALQEWGFATLRFNFRGVGTSVGTFDDGVGETMDALAAYDFAATAWPLAKITLVGFSFGAFVAYHVASRRPVVRLIAIAPPVGRFDFAAHPVPQVPWTVIQGDRDELVDSQAVLAWARELRPAPTVHLVAGAEHFFHGRMQDLKNAVQGAIAPPSSSQT
jgi:hypothetical protein